MEEINKVFYCSRNLRLDCLDKELDEAKHEIQTIYRRNGEELKNEEQESISNEEFKK